MCHTSPLVSIFLAKLLIGVTKMPNAENKELVKILKEKISRAKSIVFTDYLGISAENANTLRRKIKENDGEVVIAKNTLIKVALKEENHDVSKVENDLKNSTAMVLSYKDAISPIKAIFDFAKTIEFPKVKSAFIEGAYYGKEKVEEIKTIPSKEQLLSRVVGGLQSPITGFVGVLGGVQRKFVYAINAIAQKKGGAN
jgi:large subunit ribosomal protein L10